MNFKTGDTVMWCGTYGEVIDHDNHTVYVQFDNERVCRTFALDGRYYAIEFNNFPHLPKLEPAQRPGTFPKTLHLRVAITSILERFIGSGLTKTQLKKHYSFPVEEFIKNFELAKKANEEGDYETTRSFFDIYC